MAQTQKKLSSRRHGQWMITKVVAVYSGKDDIVRAVDVQVERAVIPKGCNTKAELAQKITTKTSVYRRPICKLSMLLGARQPSVH